MGVIDHRLLIIEAGAMWWQPPSNGVMGSNTIIYNLAFVDINATLLW